MSTYSLSFSLSPFKNVFMLVAIFMLAVTGTLSCLVLKKDPCFPSCFVFREMKNPSWGHDTRESRNKERHGGRDTIFLIPFGNKTKSLINQLRGIFSSCLLCFAALICHQER